MRGLDMWLSSSDAVYMTARDSRLVRWNGSTLAEVATPISGAPSPISGFERPLNAIWGTSSSNLFLGGGGTVGDGVLMHWNGNSWSVIYNQGIIIDVIWGTAPADVFALGNEGGFHFDGSAWTRTGQGVFEGDRIKAVWGSRSNDVWACGGNRDIYHYDGVAWIKWGSSPIGCGSLFGFSRDDIYMSGFSDGPNGTINTIGHFNGTSWSVVYTGKLPTASFDENSVWGSGPSDVHVVFDNEYLRFNGSSWEQQPLPPLGPMTIRGDSRGAIFGSGEIAGFVLGHH
jgi:hypothetical protein